MGSVPRPLGPGTLFVMVGERGTRFLTAFGMTGFKAVGIFQPVTL